MLPSVQYAQMDSELMHISHFEILPKYNTRISDQITILLGMETVGNLRHIVLDGGLDFS